VIRIGKKALKNEVMWGIRRSGLRCHLFFQAAVPVDYFDRGLIGVIGVIGIGVIGGRYWKEKFHVIKGHGPAKGASVIDDEDESPLHTQPSWARAIRVTATWLVLWWVPVIAIGLWQGWGSTLFKGGTVFQQGRGGDLVAPTPFCPMSPSRPSITMAGSRRAK